MRLKTWVFVVMILIVSSGVSYSETSFNLLYLNQSDATIVSSQGETTKIPIKARIGTVQWGLLSSHKFYTIDITYHEKLLFLTDLKAMKTEVLLDLKKMMDVSYLPATVGYVDDNKIIIEAHTFDNTQPLNIAHTYLFQYDRHTDEIQKLPINIDRGPVSVHGQRIYYTGQDGDIHCYDGSTEQSLQIKGTSPTISPDGKRLVYIFSGWIGDSIEIYTLETKKTESIVGFLAFINPIIRWSGDGRLIAIKTRSDFSVTPLYIIDTQTGDIVRKLKKTYAHNWFFIDEKW